MKIRITYTLDIKPADWQALKAAGHTANDIRTLAEVNGSESLPDLICEAYDVLEACAND